MEITNPAKIRGVQTFSLAVYVAALKYEAKGYKMARDERHAPKSVLPQIQHNVGIQAATLTECMDYCIREIDRRKPGNIANTNMASGYTP